MRSGTFMATHHLHHPHRGRCAGRPGVALAAVIILALVALLREGGGGSSGAVDDGPDSGPPRDASAVAESGRFGGSPISQPPSPPVTTSTPPPALCTQLLQEAAAVHRAGLCSRIVPLLAHKDWFTCGPTVKSEGGLALAPEFLREGAEALAEARRAALSSSNPEETKFWKREVGKGEAGRLGVGLGVKKGEG